MHTESNSSFDEDQKHPHPSPLPEGEGTDRSECERYADFGYRVERKFRNQPESAPSPGGEGWGEGRIQLKFQANHPLLTTQQ